MNDKKTTVRICAEENDKSSRFIDAYIGERGDIGFLVQDLSGGLLSVRLNKESTNTPPTLMQH